MNKKDLKHYQDILVGEKKKIITELLRDNEDYSELKEEDIGDLVDVAYKNYEKNLLFDMSQNEKHILEMIDAALERIEGGSFGKCMSCSKEIENQRLDIMPYALKCVQCKMKEEKEMPLSNSADVATDYYKLGEDDEDKLDYSGALENE